MLVGRRKQSAGGGVGGREAERVSDLHLGRGRDEANSDASRFGAADQARIGTERTRRARWRLRRNDERQATISGGQHVVRRLERVGQYLEAARESHNSTNPPTPSSSSSVHHQNHVKVWARRHSREWGVDWEEWRHILAAEFEASRRRGVEHDRIGTEDSANARTRASASQHGRAGRIREGCRVGERQSGTNAAGRQGTRATARGAEARNRDAS